jgi:hypothetical protein
VLHGVGWLIGRSVSRSVANMAALPDSFFCRFRSDCVQQISVHMTLLVTQPVSVTFRPDHIYRIHLSFRINCYCVLTDGNGDKETIYFF